MYTNTTPLEYGYMSAMAYDAKEGTHPTLIDKMWRVIHQVTRQPDIGDYQGIVYHHERRKEVVVAHRGTVFSLSEGDVGSVTADLQAVVLGKIHPQVVACLEKTLTPHVKKMLAKPGYSLTFTGHSLGGFLATLSLYICQRRHLNFYVPRSRAVVFDPVGSQDMMEGLEPHGHDGGGLGKDGIANLDITHFLSYPNYVNAFKPHAGGTKYLLKSPEQDPVVSAAANTLNPMNYLLATHRLTSILTSFDKNTGYPREGCCRMMDDWPLINVDSLKSLTSTAGQVVVAGRVALSFWRSVSHLFGTTPEEIPAWREVFGGEEFQRSIQLSVRGANERTPMPLGDQLKARLIFAEEDYRQVSRLCHFSQELADFLKNYVENVASLPTLSQWHATAFGLSEDEQTLLRSFKIEQGKIIVNNMSIYSFKERLATLASTKGVEIFNIGGFINQQITQRTYAIQTLTNELKETQNELSSLNKSSKAYTALKAEHGKLEETIQQQQQAIEQLKQAQSSQPMAIAAPLGAAALQPGAKAEVENRGITAPDIIAITNAVVSSGFFSQQAGGVRVLATAGAVSTQPGGEAKVVNHFSGEASSSGSKPAEGTLGGSMGPK